MSGGGYSVYDLETMPQDYDYIIVANSYSAEIYDICVKRKIDLKKVLFIQKEIHNIFHDELHIRNMLGQKNYERYAQTYGIGDGPFIQRMLRQYPNGFISFRGSHKREGQEKFFCGKQYYSQCYQDFFLDKFLFDRQETGFFLDIGGNHPTFINNTYFFEQKGWEGIAVEPMPKMNALWKEMRKTPCLQVAVGDRNCTLDFKEYDVDYMSGITERVHYDGEVSGNYQVLCRRLADILEEYQVSEVDFMSLDVEGYELEALQGIDFERVLIRCIVLENVGKTQDVIRDYMLKQGYSLFARLWFDDIWVKGI